MILMPIKIIYEKLSISFSFIVIWPRMQKADSMSRYFWWREFGEYLVEDYANAPTHHLGKIFSKVKSMPGYKGYKKDHKI